jgi:hypothetical protein
MREQHKRGNFCSAGSFFSSCSTNLIHYENCRPRTRCAFAQPVTSLTVMISSTIISISLITALSLSLCESLLSSSFHSAYLPHRSLARSVIANSHIDHADSPPDYQIAGCGDDSGGGPKTTDTTSASPSFRARRSDRRRSWQETQFSSRQRRTSQKGSESLERYYWSGAKLARKLSVTPSRASAVKCALETTDSSSQGDLVFAERWTYRQPLFSTIYGFF